MKREAVMTGATLKRVLKQAMTEAMEEQRQLITQAMVEAFEEIALTSAIREGEKTKPVRRDRVLSALRGRH